MSLLVVSDRRTESALLAARLRMRGLPIDGSLGAAAPRVVLVAKSALEPIEAEIIQRVLQRGGFVLQLERDGDAPIAEALSVAVPAGLDDVAGLAELAWLQALHATRTWKIDLERMPPSRLLKALRAAKDTFLLEATIGGRQVRVEIDRGRVVSARYGTLKDALALQAFEQAKSGSVQIRLTDVALRNEPLRDADAGTPVSFAAPPKVAFFEARIPPTPIPKAPPIETIDALPVAPLPVVTPVVTPVPAPVEALVEIVKVEAPVSSTEAPAIPVLAPATEDWLDEAQVFDRQRRVKRAGIAVLALAAIAGAYALVSLVLDRPPPPVVVVAPPPVPAPVVVEEPIDLPPLSVERVLRLESALVQARALQAQKKQGEAIALFEAAVLEGPTKPQYLLILARMLLDAGELDPALHMAERVTKVAPGAADAYVIMGTALQLKDVEWEKTKPLYEKYLQLAPNGQHARDVKAIIARH